MKRAGRSMKAEDKDKSGFFAARGMVVERRGGVGLREEERREHLCGLCRCPCLSMSIYVYISPHIFINRKSLR